MSNSFFSFKEFTIHQDRCAMKVGTDGVLLGAWAGVGNPIRILDVGTGTGLVALMMAQRYPKSRIVALEIDHDAASQAKENVQGSSFHTRVSVLEQDFLSYQDREGFDLIVSNPPYFKDSLGAPAAQRLLARQGQGLDFGCLLERGKDLLLPSGCLALVAPSDQMDAILSRAQTLGYGLRRRLLVRPTRTKSIKRVLLEFVLKACEDFQDEEIILSAPDGSRTTPFQLLTNDFYLNT